MTSFSGLNFYGYNTVVQYISFGMGKTVQRTRRRENSITFRSLVGSLYFPINGPVCYAWPVTSTILIVLGGPTRLSVLHTVPWRHSPSSSWRWNRKRETVQHDVYILCIYYIRIWVIFIKARLLPGVSCATEEIDFKLLIIFCRPIVHRGIHLSCTLGTLHAGRVKVFDEKYEVHGLISSSSELVQSNKIPRGNWIRRSCIGKITISRIKLQSNGDIYNVQRNNSLWYEIVVD